MLSDSPCPNVEKLRRLMLGTLAEPQAALLEEHLSRCPHCGRTVDTLAAEDSLVQTMRSQAALTPEPEGERVRQLMAKAETLWSAATAAAKGQTQSPASSQDRTKDDVLGEVSSSLAPPREPGELGRLGPFRVLGVLGCGGMGVVFHGEDVQLRRSVALKTLRPAVAATPSYRQRFLREARAAAALHHDHVMPVYQVGEEGGIPFLAMPLLAGETLEDRLRREGKLPLPEVLRLGREMAAGLAAAHERGLIHRDIKPANVWLEADAGRVKLLDFGLARAVEEESSLTHTGAITGTPGYLAPEQARAETVDHRADLFGLGCVLYRMATGEKPFQAGNTLAYLRALELERPRPPRQLAPELPPALEKLLQRLLAKDRADRPASAEAVADALRAMEQVGATPRTKPRRVFLALAAVLGLAGVALLAQIVIRLRDKDGRQTEVQVPSGGVAEVVKNGQVVGRFGDEGRMAPHGGPLGAFAQPTIPAAERFDWQPKELVAVYGTHRWKSWGSPYGWGSLAPSLTFAADGQELLMLPRLPRLNKPDTLPVVEAATGEERFRIERRNLVGATYSADGRSAAIVSGTPDDWTVEVRDTLTRKSRFRIRNSGNVDLGHVLYWLSLDPTGRRFALGYLNSTVRIWDLPMAEGEEARERTPLDWLPKNIGPVAFSADGKWMAASEAPAEQGKPWPVKVWDMETGKVRSVPDVLPEDRRIVPSMAFSPDGRLLVIGRGGDWNTEQVSVRDADTGKPAWKVASLSATAFAFSPDGATLALSVTTGNPNEGVVTLFDSRTGEKQRQMRRSLPCSRLLFAPDGKRLAGASGGNAYLWDVATGKLLGEPDEAVDFLALSGDGKTLALRVRSPKDGQVVRILDLTTGEDRCVVDLPPDFQFFASVLAPDGRTFASGVSPGGVANLWLWDVSTATPKRMPVETPGQGVHLLAFSSDGRTLAALYPFVPGFALWSTSDWKYRFEKLPDGMAYKCNGLAISPDSKTVAIDTLEKGLLLHDLATGKQRRTLGGPKVEYHTDRLAFTPDGKRLLVSDYKRGRLCDVETGKETLLPFIPTASGPDGSVYGVPYAEGPICRWSHGSVQTVWQAPGVVGRVAVTPDGRYLFTNNANGTVYVLRLASGAGAGEGK